SERLGGGDHLVEVLRLRNAAFDVLEPVLDVEAPPRPEVQVAPVVDEPVGVDLDARDLAVEHEQLVVEGCRARAVVDQLLDEDPRDDVPVRPLAGLLVEALAEPPLARRDQRCAVEVRLAPDDLHPARPVRRLDDEAVRQVVERDLRRFLRREVQPRQDVRPESLLDVLARLVLVRQLRQQGTAVERLPERDLLGEPARPPDARPRAVPLPVLYERLPRGDQSVGHDSLPELPQAPPQRSPHGWRLSDLRPRGNGIGRSYGSASRTYACTTSALPFTLRPVFASTTAPSGSWPYVSAPIRTPPAGARLSSREPVLIVS